jgi:hypothetical protein
VDLLLFRRDCFLKYLQEGRDHSLFKEQVDLLNKKCHQLKALTENERVRRARAKAKKEFGGLNPGKLAREYDNLFTQINTGFANIKRTIKDSVQNAELYERQSKKAHAKEEQRRKLIVNPRATWQDEQEFLGYDAGKDKIEVDASVHSSDESDSDDEPEAFTGTLGILQRKAANQRNKETAREIKGKIALCQRQLRGELRMVRQSIETEQARWRRRVVCLEGMGRALAMRKELRHSCGTK